MIIIKNIDGINLFFAKLLHILYLILASSKLGKARERTKVK